MPINKKLLNQDINKNNLKIKNLKNKLRFADNNQKIKRIEKQIENAQEKGNKLFDLKFDAFNEYGTNPKAGFKVTGREKKQIPAKYKIPYKKIDRLSKAERKGKI
jgi:hypothetical protein|tara:strand:+ start:3088 stop:3402 length:315 start_codon:yes stop_codon:yes gene_type:complete